ncbi:MAG: DEAD/DEAH box helicase family protein [Planctomycetota bacterium]
MFELKHYQNECLDALTRYLRGVSRHGRADMPFAKISGRDYLTSSLPEDLRGVPYVCLRVPTGGGKTLIAAHAVPIVTSELLRAEHSIVLWLAPSTPIVEQTLKALRDPKHPYRQALQEKLGGQVEVMSLSEALAVTRGTLDGATTIVVSTIQALRVEKTDGRKVYEQNGALMHHFSSLADEQVARLERHEGAGAVESLANVFKLRRPIVIVDEAHNARTELSFETLTRLDPACIVEFTATPDQRNNPSNVLHHVSALQLKAEHMVKLPIRLVNRPQWREAVQAAIARQTKLEELAKAEEEATGEYIRPIVLFQAEANRGDDPVTVEMLLKALVDEFKIPREHVAIRTGKDDELDNRVLTRESKHRFIITVQALREGWDCPFAYVLCSVANMSSSTAVEQILGRILRLPRARLKEHDELNKAYAIATSQKFSEAAHALTEILEKSGFEKYETQTLIERGAVNEGSAKGTLFDDTDEEEAFTESFSEAPKPETIPEEIRQHLKVETSMKPGKPVKITYSGPPLTKAATTALREVFNKEDDQDAAERLGRKSRGENSAPAALGKPFAVPRLGLRVDGQLEIFEDQFREAPWKLSDQDPTLSPSEFAIASSSSGVGEIYIDEDKGIFKIRELHEQLALIDIGGPKTEAELAVWLDRQIPHPDIVPSDSTLFLRKMIELLIKERKCSLADLVAARFRLRSAAEVKINTHRLRVMDESFQHLLQGTDDTAAETDPSIAFDFPLNVYPARRLYEGRITYAKHYYDVIGDMNAEEAECAQIIENLDETLYWVRNIERHPQCSFFLPTSTDNFYPDFVALLKDGRVLCIEYKGADRISNDDTKEKRMVGELWAERSNGKCLFRLVGKEDAEGIINSAVDS